MQSYTLGNIPSDILFVIFKYLNLRDLLSVLMVNRYLVLNSKDAWERRYPIWYQQIIREMNTGNVTAINWKQECEALEFENRFPVTPSNSNLNSSSALTAGEVLAADNITKDLINSILAKDTKNTHQLLIGLVNLIRNHVFVDPANEYSFYYRISIINPSHLEEIKTGYRYRLNQFIINAQHSGQISNLTSIYEIEKMFHAKRNDNQKRTYLTSYLEFTIACHQPVKDILEINNSILPQELLLVFALKHGHVEFIKHLIENNKCYLNAIVDDKQKETTPLIIASQFGQLAGVKYLLEQGADLNLASNYYGTPLQCALLGGHLLLAKYLLHKGAEFTFLIKHFSDNSRRLRKHNPLLNEIVDSQAYLVPEDYLRITAAENGHPHVVKYLLERGAFTLLQVKKDLLIFLLETSCFEPDVQIIQSFYKKIFPDLANIKEEKNILTLTKMALQILDYQLFNEKERAQFKNIKLCNNPLENSQQIDAVLNVLDFILKMFFRDIFYQVVQLLLIQIDQQSDQWIRAKQTIFGDSALAVKTELNGQIQAFKALANMLKPQNSRMGPLNLADEWVIQKGYLGELYNRWKTLFCQPQQPEITQGTKRKMEDQDEDQEMNQGKDEDTTESPFKRLRTFQ